MADLHGFDRGQFLPFDFSQGIAFAKAASAPGSGPLDDNLMHVAAHCLTWNDKGKNRDTGPNRMQAQEAAKD